MKEAYVSFEVAKLLKEKGFGWECCNHFYCRKEDGKVIERWVQFPADRNSDRWINKYAEYVSAPTQQMACRWLREEKGIHIMVSTGMNVCSKPMRFYHANLAQMEEDKTIYGDPIDVDFDIYEDAVEAALEYCLTNLI